jgi:hypothetical protein
VPRECRFITLLARLNEPNDAVQDLHLLPQMNRRNRFFVRLNDPLLQSSERLATLSDFCNAVERARRLRFKV